MEKQSYRKQTGAKIDSETYRMIKALAIIQNRTIGEVIDDALREYLAENMPIERTKWPKNYKRHQT